MPPKRRSLRLFGLSGVLGVLVTLVVLAPGTAASAEPSVDQINRRIQRESARPCTAPEGARRGIDKAQ